MVYVAFAVGIGGLQKGRCSIDEFLVNSNARLARSATGLRLGQGFGKSGNFLIAVEGNRSIADVSQTLSRVLAREFAVFTIAEFRDWLEKLKAALSSPPLTPLGRRATPGAVMNVEPGNRLSITLPTSDRMTFNHFVHPRVCGLWKLDVVRPDGFLDRTHREGGWGAVAKLMMDKNGGSWTARALSTLEGVARRLHPGEVTQRNLPRGRQASPRAPLREPPPTTNLRMHEGSKIPTEEDLAIFREPEDLCILVEPDRLGISDESFFNEVAGGLHQKLREAWMLARLGVGISHAISPVLVSVVDGPLLDGILRFENGSEWEFEVVTVNRPGRRLGDEYRGGQRPQRPLADFSGEPSNPLWPRDPILGKVLKVQKQRVIRHLVAYLNYGGGLPDLAQMAQAIPEAGGSFEAVWILTGWACGLLFAKINVGHPVRKWQSYWEWLPEERRG